MSFANKNYTQFDSQNDLAYNQFKPGDPVSSSLYDVNMDCDPGLRCQNSAILVVDSKDRQINEEPNKYDLKLKKEYRDVISIELKRAVIPNSDYTLNERANIFYFQDNASQVGKCQFHKVELPIGNFPIDDPTCDSVRSLLEAGLNLVAPGITYTVEVDPNTLLFTITQVAGGSGVFNILFKVPKLNGDGSGSNLLPCSMYEILGFKPFDHVGKLKYVGEYTYNLRPIRYLIVRIKGLERVDSVHNAVQDSFCILPLDTKGNNFMLSDNCDEIDNEVYQKDFNPPLGKLDRLNFEFFDNNGKPYNFRGKDHVLVFEVTSLSRFSNYNKQAKSKC
jgi:hypothetical protein